MSSSGLSFPSHGDTRGFPLRPRSRCPPRVARRSARVPRASGRREGAQPWRVQLRRRARASRGAGHMERAAGPAQRGPSLGLRSIHHGGALGLGPWPWCGVVPQPVAGAGPARGVAGGGPRPTCGGRPPPPGLPLHGPMKGNGVARGTSRDGPGRAPRRGILFGIVVCGVTRWTRMDAPGAPGQVCRLWIRISLIIHYGPAEVPGRQGNPKPRGCHDAARAVRRFYPTTRRLSPQAAGLVAGWVNRTFSPGS
jgi:hypothetical protein